MKCTLACLLLVAACGGGGTTPTSTTPAAPEPAAEVVLPEGVPFDKLDQDQRIAFMKQKVMPAMTPVFQNHDPKKYAEFGCVTCHGEQAKQGHFDMPNPDLPKLNFKDMSQHKPADLEWMGKDVKPSMAKILGLPEYTPETPTGFGCLHCHTQVE